MTPKEFVLSILPQAVAEEMANGWMILARPGHSPCIVSGAKNDRAAWFRAAKMLGLRAQQKVSV